MRYTTTFLRIAGVAAALLHQGAALQSSSNLQVRDLSACEQAYGAGWMQCSGGKNAGCYNPEKGQTCCAVDAGHCQAGFYCAPAPGKCCPEDQSAEECGMGVDSKVLGLPGLVGHELSEIRTMTTTKIITLTINTLEETSIMSSTNTVAEPLPNFETVDTAKVHMSGTSEPLEDPAATTASTSATASDDPVRLAVTENPGLITVIGAGPVTETPPSPAKSPSKATSETAITGKPSSTDGFPSTTAYPPPLLMFSNKTNSTASPIISSQTTRWNAGSSLALAIMVPVMLAIMASW